MEKYLYIDESGVPDNPLDKNGKQKLKVPRVFCLGGIIVDKNQKQFLENEYKRLIEDYFTGIELGSNFKLHYNPLRMGDSPYSDIGKERSQQLKTEIFEIIKKSDAKLLSFTLDLIGHYKKYATPVNPLALGLIVLFERFVNHAQKENIKTGYIIYERFNKGLRNLVYENYKFLEKTKFKTKLDLNKIIKSIIDGDPTKEPILQFTDFWTCLPFLNEQNFLDVQDYVQQYHNFNTERDAGNVSIRY